MSWSRPTCSSSIYPTSYRGRDDVPRVVRTDAGDDVWVYDGREFPNIGLNAVAGRPREEYGIDPTSYEEMRPGLLGRRRPHRRHERERRTRLVVFPVVPAPLRSGVRRSPGQGTRARSGPGLQRLAHPFVVREAPGSLHPPRPAAVLGHRTDGRGNATTRRTWVSTRCRSPRTLSKLGLASLHSEHWDPFWAACQDLEILPCLHIGSSSTITVTAPGRAIRRDRDAAAHEHRRRRRGSGVVAGTAEVPRPEDRAVRRWRRLVALLPRQDRPRVSQAVGVDASGLRRPAPERRVQGAESSPASSTIRSHPKSPSVRGPNS